ncbi:MAG: dihydroxyacetone kinase subunit DhaL [Pseudonocardiaceae bacterium]
MCEKVTVESLIRWMREFARAIAANRGLLTRLDSAIGDGDHGINLDRGLAAVATALGEHRPSPVAVLLRDVVAKTLMSAVGGTSGALYGTFFLRMAAAAGQAESLDAVAFARALRAGLAGVVQRGQAVVGDKTMVDALDPAIEALDAALAEGAGLGVALRRAAAAAEAGRDATVPMPGRKGRASYLAQRSVGHQDPGATSAALLIAAAATALGCGPGDRP